MQLPDYFCMGCISFLIALVKHLLSRGVGYKPALEGRRREVDSPFKHRMEKLTEELLGCRLSTLEILYFLIGKEEADHGTYLIDPDLYVMLIKYICDLYIQILFITLLII